jgi:hypothetical protein
MTRRPSRRPLLVTSSLAAALLLTVGCGAGGPVMDLTDLEDHELIFRTIQNFYLHKEEGGVTPVYSTLLTAIIPQDGEDELFFNELREASNASEAECYQLPFGTEVALAGTPLEVDLGGVQSRPFGPFGIPQDTCIRPQAALREIDADLYQEGDVLDFTVTTGTAAWDIALDNPLGQRRLERIDDGPVVEGGEVRFVWSHQSERPVFRDFRRGGRSPYTEVRIERPATPDVETGALWEGRELTIDLPQDITGPVTIHISYGYVQETETTSSAGGRGPMLNLDHEIEDCPAARCRVQLDFALAPIELDIQPAS